MPYLLIVAVVLAAVTALFAIQNATVVAVSFLGWEWQASLALILILTLGIGILVGYLAGLPSAMKKGSELRQSRKRVRELEGLVGVQGTKSATAGFDPADEDPLDGS
jgi:putative membrane protein